jgi:hypothetical protein
MAKLKLDIDPDPEIFLIAISSHVNDYRLCWSLNRQLGLALCRRAADIVEPGPEQMAHYAVFDHTEESTQAHFSLVNNHAPEGVLVADQRLADFFLVVERCARMPSAEVLEQVRRAEFVLTAFPLDPNGLRGAHKLLR